VLQNPITFVVFAILLWRFFYQRTRGMYDSFLEDHHAHMFLFSAEEYHLVRFFGDEYKEYRRRVGTKIPFVP
jgi:protein-S-isoprenylcysteine O-methyltransferase